MSIKAAIGNGAKGGAVMTGYGVIGVVGEAIAKHFWSWLPDNGVVAAAIMAGIHGAQQALQGWGKRK